MAIPNILALDFDGVLCDGMREYFETSRRTYMKVWPTDTVPGEDLFPAFRALRPVIMTGWEMPMMLRAIVQGHPVAAILQDWEKVRDELVNVGPLQGSALVSALTHTLDEVRRDWIATDPRDWLERNVPYCSLDEVRRLVTEPERTVLVTTKEGEFARQILDHWGVHLADIQGKEAGTHKCDNLRGLIARLHGGRMGGVRAYGSSKTGLRPCNTSPPMPIWRTSASSWRIGAITRRRHGRRCRRWAYPPARSRAVPVRPYRLAVTKQRQKTALCCLGERAHRAHNLLREDQRWQRPSKDQPLTLNERLRPGPIHGAGGTLSLKNCAAACVLARQQLPGCRYDLPADNPLLQEPLKPEHIKHRLLGHWGSSPGISFLYTHLNRVIKKYDQDMLFMVGAGHGAPGFLGPCYLEGTYSEFFPDKSQDAEGLHSFFKQFSFPGGIGSHCTPETPGSIHEGGELGYSVSHAFGAAFDNPDLIVVVMPGDGESETGPLATSWHSNKFLNPMRDGAVLPVLHLNGYKINNPTLLARISHEELENLFKGYGWTPYFVEGSDPESMHQAMAATLDHCVADIHQIQQEARTQWGGQPAALAHDCAADSQRVDGPQGSRWAQGGRLLARAPGTA